MTYLPEQTVTRIAVATGVNESTIKDMKLNFFALLDSVYNKSIVGTQAGGFGRIVEVDEALKESQSYYISFNIY